MKELFPEHVTFCLKNFQKHLDKAIENPGEIYLRGDTVSKIKKFRTFPGERSVFNKKRGTSTSNVLPVF
mgnify:CR=1 FL=1